MKKLRVTVDGRLDERAAQTLVGVADERVAPQEGGDLGDGGGGGEGREEEHARLVSGGFAVLAGPMDRPAAPTASEGTLSPGASSTVHHEPGAISARACRP
jgi:hypothetical protein